MSDQLSAQTIMIVKATVPALEEHGLRIIETMYRRMFEDPEIRDLFNESHHGESGSQPKALTAAILAYARNIDNLVVLGGDVERIAQKHAGLQILPEHYPVVGSALIDAIKDVLGEEANESVISAWSEAYNSLANILMGRESAIYTQLASSHGGWTGWREFQIEKKIKESEIITSFVLRPSDGREILEHKPGQYLTFKIELPSGETLKRNYSISSSPNNKAYRISVKREPHGRATNWLHDWAHEGTTLLVAPPTGEFFLDEEAKRPVVLLSGGVGLTPMVSMMESIVGKPLLRAAHYVHGTHDGTTHAMGPHIRSLVENRSDLTATTFYLSPRSTDVLGRDHDVAGCITMEWLRENTPIADADYYLCGPKPFLKNFVQGLQRAGVARDRIHYEFFGPVDELDAA
ncbi:NO-inducible flavohemoprotein [Brucella tritici]|uniref:Flavohemoprotein n=1 Tax=Brucella tritici TaxID=94626 RepID=A0A6L3YMS3_9HYPH|nr:NO-inducible flavohemoprotein [Brucella tritici]KAB2684363.1 NO-inducible flavohemoprotein [Brucella tritici]